MSYSSRRNGICAMRCSRRAIRMLVLILCLLQWDTPCSCQDEVGLKLNATDTASDSSYQGSGIEKEVLGPLRIWHLIFIVFVILLSALVVACCCLNIRVPRSRQDIEENYFMRMLNKRYMRVLEGRPDQLLTKHAREETTTPKETRSSFESLSVISQPLGQRGVGPPTKPKPSISALRQGQSNEAANFILKGQGSKAKGRSRDGESTNKMPPSRGTRREEELNEAPPPRRPRPPMGIETPLAIQPRDILALMKKAGAQQLQ